MSSRRPLERAMVSSAALALMLAGMRAGWAQDPPPPPAVPVPPVEAAPLDASGPGRIAGNAVAIDPRTVMVDGTALRLFGVAPAEDSLVGQLRARLALDELLAEAAAACTTIDRDRDGTLRGVCQADGTDLGEALIVAGLLLPSRADTYSGSVDGLGERYDAAEAKARAAGLGIWAALQPRPEDRPAWIPRWLWRIPAGFSLLAGSALGLLGLIGLIVSVVVLARRSRPPASGWEQSRPQR